MGSLQERSTHDFEDTSASSTSKVFQKMSPFHAAEEGPFSETSQVGSVNMFSCACRSIKIVVFSNKLNLLMPFGPVAILVHNLTGHHVSYDHLH